MRFGNESRNQSLIQVDFVQGVGQRRIPCYQTSEVEILSCKCPLLSQVVLSVSPYASATFDTGQIDQDRMKPGNRADREEMICMLVEDLGASVKDLDMHNYRFTGYSEHLARRAL